MQNWYTYCHPKFLSHASSLSQVSKPCPSPRLSLRSHPASEIRQWFWEPQGEMIVSRISWVYARTWSCPYHLGYRRSSSIRPSWWGYHRLALNPILVAVSVIHDGEIKTCLHRLHHRESSPYCQCQFSRLNNIGHDCWQFRSLDFRCNLVMSPPKWLATSTMSRIYILPQLVTIHFR